MIQLTTYSILGESDVDSLPQAYAGMGCKHINGLVKTDRQIRMILNIKKIQYENKDLLADAS
ncbi:MAG: hypothetical protein MJE63_00045 [Proteobacteria bacterium]|nr:hypothetical protein [Pseudomonadota bacterium]